MLLRPMIRPAVRVGIAFSASAVVSTSMRTLLPAPRTTLSQVVTWVGTFAISTYVADKATDYIMQELVDPILLATHIVEDAKTK